MNYLGYYLIGINVLGFILFIINNWLYAHTEKIRIDKLLTVVCLIGGSAGILLSILIFDRRAEKENMMSRVFVTCMFVIQLVIFLVIRGHLTSELSLKFWEFFAEHKIIIVYLAIINFIAFAAFAVDKVAATEHRSRIRNVTLLGLAFIGGSVGALLAMYLLHHKTQKDYYTFGVPLIMVMQVVVILYAMNAAW